MSAKLITELRHHQEHYAELIHGPLCGKAADAIERLGAALSTIADIAEGSGTINSLPHIAKIARGCDHKRHPSPRDGRAATRRNDSMPPRQLALDNEILRGVVGSTSHGTAIEGQDDLDEMGVFIEPPEKVCGLTPCDHPSLAA